MRFPAALTVCLAVLAVAPGAIRTTAGETTTAIRLGPADEDHVRGGSGAGIDLRVSRFHTTRELRVLLDGIGGGERMGKLYAYGWLVATAGQRLLWNMVDATPIERLPGRRGLRYHDEITLPAGDYQLYFVSGRRWEIKGPIDLGRLLHGRHPRRGDWQVSIRTDAGDAEALQISGEEPAIPPGAIRLAPLGDSAVQRRRFRLDERAQVSILALGESYPGGRRLADRSWLVELVDRRRVWHLDVERTEPAGGSRKNRVQRLQLELEPGSYELIAVTDDSHSYQDWNALPPYLPELWGVSLTAPAELLHFDGLVRERVVADLTGAGDDELLTATIVIERPTRVRLIGLGEWSSGSGELVDRGWIEDAASGDVIWAMRFEDSYHAGGSDKNRAVDTSLELLPGRYRLRYRSDDSHSFPDFNAAPPFEPWSWGIRMTTFVEDGWRLVDLDTRSTRRRARR